jgi:hypothetical protein
VQNLIAGRTLNIGFERTAHDCEDPAGPGQ